MTIAIMQPYIFPYIGYYQLISAVDKFIIYDDVNYIKQGWINRNKILINNKEQLFAVPLEGSSSFKLIKETGLSIKSYKTWEKKFFRSIEQSYRKAPNFKECFELIEAVFSKSKDPDTTIAYLATVSIIEVFNYLGISNNIVLTSAIYNNEHLSGEERVIDICLKEKAKRYVNPEGGQHLYSQKKFGEKGLELNFIKPQLEEYNQFNMPFVKGLSIIDILMFNSKEKVNQMLNNYYLIK